MNKRLWIILAILVIAVVGGLIFWRNSASGEKNYAEFLDGKKVISTQNIVDAKKKAANNENLKVDENAIIPDHFLGKKDAKVVVVEYEDFACSACISLATYADKIHEDYKDRVLFIFRNFNLGQNTSTLSESAAEAAYLLGGNSAEEKEASFWKMHDLLFSSDVCMEGKDKNQCQNQIMIYASEMKFDETKFENALTSYTNNGINDKINRDKSLGKTAGVKATPTWFVAGEKIEGGSDSSWRAALDKALKNAE